MPARRRLNILARLAVAIAWFPVARLWRRSGNRWAFGGPGSHPGGNAFYLFLWCRLHRPDIRATWISGDRATARFLMSEGLPAHYRWSFPGIVAALSARVFLFSHDPADVNAPLHPGARLMNLWHGVGTKTLHTGARPGGALRRWLRGFVYPPTDVVVATSPAMQAHFAHQFGIAPTSCPQLGYPRLDGARDPQLAHLVRRLDRQHGFDLRHGRHEVYLYMPTFRDSGRRFLTDALRDPARLDAVLRRRRALLWVKPHPRTVEPVPGGFATIRRWPDPVDPHGYLSELTGLITDYSSILYDYLAVRDAGAIRYVFDEADYLSRDRDLLSADVPVAGVRVTSFAGLLETLADGRANDTSAMGDVAAVRSWFWGDAPRTASPMIVDYVKHTMLAASQAAPARASTAVSA